MMMADQDPTRTPAPPTAGSACSSASAAGLQAVRKLATSRPTPRSVRLGVASTGALALVAALVTTVLGILNLVPFLLPLLCVLTAAAAVAVLRVLAIRSRHARVQRAFDHAMAPVLTTANPVHAHAPARVVAAPQRPTQLFDAESAGARPLSAMELRTAALAVARGTADGTSAPAAATTQVLPAGATAWVPVELPRPTYVDAAKAEREAPAPLDLPEAPRPTTRTPIKASEAAARSTTLEEEAAASSAAPVTGRINLDDVLQRRRA